MGCIKETASHVYDVGSNLIMELQNNQSSVKLDPATCKNRQFTFTKPIHVANGLVYRKIPKISPYMYKPPKPVMQKTLR